MWNLFKEVWRSLFKNKATVAGLTILVFLTSGIFTVMHDTAKAMKKQYERYQEMSTSHDLTVDLNLPINGSVYNNGFFINGLSKEDGSADYNKPIKYVSENFRESTNIINFSEVRDNYFSLSNFIEDPNYNNKYISRSDFLNLYSTYIPEKPETGILDLDFSKSNKQFSLKQKRIVPIYKKVNNNFQKEVIKTTLNKSATYQFDKDYILSDISYITSKDENSVNISQLSTLFINPMTNVMTFDSLKGYEWEDDFGVIKINGSELAHLLGFSPLENNNFVYKVDKNITPKLITIDENDKASNFSVKRLNNNFSYNDLFQDRNIEVVSESKFIFEAKEKYNIPLNWAFKKNRITHYERKLYETTYTGDTKDKWTGSYKTFMENLITEFGEIPNEYAKFSFWEKSVTTETIPFVEKNGSIVLSNDYKSTEDKNIITLDEMNFIKLKVMDQSEQPSGIDFDKFKFNEDKYQTIAEIEGYKEIDQNLYNSLSNKSIANDTLIKIRNGALTITKLDIYKYIEKKVSNKNIGIRQSITIDSFVDNEGKKVYHLVNTGDEKESISGIINNINKLINSSKYPSLNKSSQNIADYFRTKEVDPYIANVIISQASVNILPFPEYIKPDFNFDEVIYTNELNNDVSVQNRVKVYKLAHFINNPTETTDKYNVFANIGITPFGENKFLILVPEFNNKNEIIRWRNAKINNLQNGILQSNQLHKWLLSNNLTLKVFLPNNSFVEKSPDYTNSVYVPFGFRGPDVEVVNQALNENTLKLGIERLQRNIINTSFYKEGFIKEDTIFVFIKALNTTFDKNDFAKVFSSGNINFNVLPKIILDGLYEITHDLSGDYLRKFLLDFIDKLIELTSKYNNETTKKEYLARNLDNLFSFISLLSGNKFLNFNSLISILNVSKDVEVFLSTIKDIVNSINFRKITDSTNDFFINKHNKTQIIDGKKYVRKLSLFDIMLAILGGIEQTPFKNAIVKILDNINIDYVTDFSNKDNPIFLLLDFLPGSFKLLFENLNAYKTDSKNKYKNVIDGLKFLIKNFDLNTFIKILNEKVKEVKFSVEAKEFNKILDTYVDVTRDNVLTNLEPNDIIYAFLKSIFNTPGSNKRVKEELVKMLNLSSKGTSIEIFEGKYITIPAADNEKIGFFEVINLLSSNNSTSTATTPSNNVATHSSPKSIFTKIEILINYLENLNKDIEVDSLSLDNKETILRYFNINVNNEKVIKLEQLKNIIKDWKEIINIFKLDQNKYSIDDITHSFADLSTSLIDYKNSSNSGIFNIISSKILSQLVPANYSGFNYLKDIFPIIKVWFKIFDVKNVSHKRSTEFANALLELANKKDVIESFNSFELFQPSAQNIAGYEETNFGVSRSLANPRLMRNLFFAKDNGIYKNIYLRDLIQRFPEFTEYLSTNDYLLTQTFSYIAASSQFYGIDKDIKEFKKAKVKYHNIFSLYLNEFINNFLQKDVIIKKYNNLNQILFNEYNNLSFDSIGVSDILINNVLRQKFPQMIIWMLTDTNNIGDNGVNVSNLSYFIQNKLINFEDLLSDEKTVKEFIKSFTKETVFVPSVENDVTFQIAIDNDIFVKLQDEISKNPTKYQFFGIDLNEFFFAILNSITGLAQVNNVLTFDQPASYIAKVNYAFLKQNNKEIYTGEIPKNPVEVRELINLIPDKYTININGSKYIIIGEDISFDYFYPILDEANLQVNTKDQAIVYVNNNGFDRVRQAYRGTLVKEYLTVKYDGKSDGSLKNLQNNIENFVQSQIDDVANLKRTYLYSELDPINPERSLRVKTVEQIINSISYTSNILLAILISLVTVSVVFIIKRYISNKNKVIGILIAQGYTPLQIASSLSVFAIFTLLIGDLFGYIVGFLLQSQGIKILQSYWTVPVETLNFEPLTLILSLIIPFIAMTILIIVIALRSLRYKSIDLMSGIVEVNITELHNKYQKAFRKRKITTKFGASLIFNSFWKLTSFGISVVLASITTIIGFGTFGVFEKSINQTYINRKYNYKFDLVTPTNEGGLYNPFSAKDLERVLYVPSGDIRELNQYQPDYFAAGSSKAINLFDEVSKKHKNGEPTPFDGHVITQFSVNLKIASSVSIDPFEVVYNSLPDTQKSRILKLRNDVGYGLMKSQEGLVFLNEVNDKGETVESNIININKTLENGVTEFFQYIPNADNIINGKFFFVTWDNDQKIFNHKVITTQDYRDEYREFLIKGYKWLEKNTEIRDYYVSFNGVFLNEETNETYTYLESNLKKEDIRIYGYKTNSSQIRIMNKDEKDLLKSIEEEFTRNGSSLDKPIPLIINNVSKRKFDLKKGDQIKLKINNKVNRLTKNIESKLEKDSLTNTEESLNKEYTFYVYDYNPTFINNEFIIPKSAADMIIGFDDLIRHKKEILKDNLPADFDENKYKFNGILSTDKLPIQLILSTGLYSPSGYSGSLDSFNIENTSNKDKKDFFDALFATKETNPNIVVEGMMKRLGYDNLDIAKFLNKNFDKEKDNFVQVYKEARENPEIYIKEFASMFDNQLFIPSAYTLESKDIEVGFTLSIAKTVQIIVTIVTALSFMISIIILIIISTILINENERNIAIWSILGYSNKEKIKMFFGIYVPFIIISLLFAFPLAYGFMSVFSGFLTTSASISIPLTISFINIVSTTLVVFGVFIIASVLSWININKIKAIDLLKGK
ncbi:ABC transporter permease protein [Mycoplasmopsis canis UFG1]|uniref:FtsX-like permease family protein n=1 Tax=Mycoplasmopsis canis TaxID=29555 RepID=UPI00025B05EC|nr:FtsX-like permease family protein [Mycoplasmopsis canis]EIE42262.1 ABC transporter permease protein [Mycoplasmopsis canis UFG1]